MTNTRSVIILKNAVFKSLIVGIELRFLGHHAYRLSNVLLCFDKVEVVLQRHKRRLPKHKLVLANSVTIGEGNVTCRSQQHLDVTQIIRFKTIPFDKD
jgi:hypothetical protein